MSNNLSIAVISDLHCHLESGENDDTYLYAGMLRRPLEKHPIEALKKLVAENGIRADVLLGPGDFTNKCSQEGFVAGWEYFQAAVDFLSAHIAAATLGNHDVDSYRIHAGRGPFDVAKDLDPERFPVARAFASPDEYWSRGSCLIQTEIISLLIVNSVGEHYSEEEAKRGKLTESQLEDIDERLGSSTLRKWRIALVHHHPVSHAILGMTDDDLLVGGSELVAILESHGFQLLVHGHKHYPRVRYSPAGRMVIFASGSFSAFSERMLSRTRNTFHLIQLSDERITGCENHGTIETWVFSPGVGWQRHSRDSADFPTTTGFGCRAPIEDIATLVSRSLEVRDPLGWDELLEAVPQVRYLVPNDLDALFRTLEEENGIITYERKNRPGLIGHPIQPVDK